jgi:microcin C transport system substrate-binding protein
MLSKMCAQADVSTVASLVTWQLRARTTKGFPAVFGRLIKTVCVAGPAILAGSSLAAAQKASEPVHQHALSLLGEPKYKADFKHFEYVNPLAPKGGRVRMAALGTFDSLNPILYKGTTPIGLSIVNITLTEASLDEPATSYCLVCEWLSFAPDYSSVTFKLRDAARFHDGKPITADDLVFSLESAKAHNPSYSLYFKNIARTEVAGPKQITFHFDQNGNRDLIQLIGGALPILPKHYWTGKDDKGVTRDISQTTLELPLGAGPYRIKESVSGRSIVYERVADDWARNLPVRIGKNNFDEIRYEYFKDSTPAIEAFKAGQLDFRPENSAKYWATEYGFKAVKDGLVKKREITIKRVDGMQAYVFNTRRDKLADPRVRQAFNLAFDFEWAASNLFFNQYKRVGSYFENSDLKATGLPVGLELEILTPFKAQLPPEVFTTEFKNPVNGTTENIRANLGQAVKLLAAAGWQMKNGVMTNDKGQPFNVEFLLDDPLFERITLPLVKSLERIGIKAAVRQVDHAQMKHRTDTFDFDIVITSYRQSEVPGNEQRDYWTTGAAEKSGSGNYMGLKNPAVDAIVEKLIAAKGKDELVAATRALDRVLLWLHLVVPHWYAPHERVAYWDMFSEPAILPSRSVGFPTVWWFDDAKAKALQARK